MDALDVIEQVGAGFGEDLVAASMDTLAFELAEEALGGGIVAAMAHGAHAADDVVVLQEPADTRRW